MGPRSKVPVVSLSSDSGITSSPNLTIYCMLVHEETRELPGERDNAKNNARCTKARKATHGLDGQLHQDVDRTLRVEHDTTEHTIVSFTVQFR